MSPAKINTQMLKLAAALIADLQPRSVLVALSGGPDSVALLHLMVEVGQKQKLEVFAAHVDYRLRGEESDQEEQFCRELCDMLGVKLFVKRHSLRIFTAGNLQEKAREIRYKFFESLCDKHSIDLIATGHNADDNAETILFNLARGAGTFGLTGIAERSGSIIRPLLNFTRADILEYLRAHNLEYRTDSSNLTDKYSRNQLRHRVMPEMMASFGPQVIDNISRSGRLLAEQADYLRQQADRCYNRVQSRTRGGKIVIAWRRLKRYHITLRRLTLALAYEKLTGSLRGFELAAAERLLTLAERGVGKADFIAGLCGEAVGDKLYIYRPSRTQLARRLTVPGEVLIRQLSCIMRSEPLNADQIGPRKLRSGGDTAYCDLKKIKGELRIRLPRAGDRFQPLGMQGTKKLSDFFVDRKIDRPLREETLIVHDTEKIVWVAGVEISEAVKVTSATKRVLRLELRDD